MAEKKIVFVAFAIEDEWLRTALHGQSLQGRIDEPQRLDAAVVSCFATMST